MMQVNETKSTNTALTHKSSILISAQLARCGSFIKQLEDF